MFLLTTFTMLLFIMGETSDRIRIFRKFKDANGEYGVAGMNYPNVGSATISGFLFIAPDITPEAAGPYLDRLADELGYLLVSELRDLV